MKIYVTGISGTGKTSITNALISKGVTAIDIDDLCHWENKYTGERTGWEPGSSDEWHASHSWLCDVERLKERLAKERNIVVSGFASNQREYANLFDKIFLLHATPETIFARIHARLDNDFGKHPAEQKRIMDSRGPLETMMVEKGAVLLDAERPLEEIVTEIQSNLL